MVGVGYADTRRHNRCAAITSRDKLEAASRREPWGKCIRHFAWVTTARQSSTSYRPSAPLSLSRPSRFSFIRDRKMQKVTPYLANGCPKSCWGCGKPFIIRDGRADAIVGPGARLYCSRTHCEEAALLPLVLALQAASPWNVRRDMIERSSVA